MVYPIILLAVISLFHFSEKEIESRDFKEPAQGCPAGSGRAGRGTVLSTAPVSKAALSHFCAQLRPEWEDLSPSVKAPSRDGSSHSGLT